MRHRASLHSPPDPAAPHTSVRSTAQLHAVPSRAVRSTTVLHAGQFHTCDFSQRSDTLLIDRLPSSASPSTARAVRQVNSVPHIRQGKSLLRATSPDGRLHYRSRIPSTRISTDPTTCLDPTRHVQPERVLSCLTTRHLGTSSRFSELPITLARFVLNRSVDYPGCFCTYWVRASPGDFPASAGTRHYSAQRMTSSNNTMRTGPPRSNVSGSPFSL